MAKLNKSKEVIESADGLPLINADFGHLIAVIDATFKLQETASNACVIEIRRKVLAMAMTAESVGEMNANAVLWDRFQKDSREYNVERMKAFSAFISSKEQAIHAASLNFTEANDGTAYCECQAFRLRDESTIDEIRYTASYSGMYNQLWTAFLTILKRDPAAAFEALASDKASAELRREYAAIMEAEREAQTDKSDASTAGGPDPVPLPEDAPEWLVEAFNAADSLKRLFRGAWKANPEYASAIVPAVTEKLQGIFRDVQTAVLASDIADPEPVDTDENS